MLQQIRGFSLRGYTFFASARAIIEPTDLTSFLNDDMELLSSISLLIQEEQTIHL